MMTNRGPNDGRSRHRKPPAAKPESLPVVQEEEEFDVEELFRDELTPTEPPPLPVEFSLPPPPPSKAELETSVEPVKVVEVVEPPPLPPPPVIGAKQRK
jgi:hypothetical protein